MMRGLPIKKLLMSDIFLHELQCEKWPEVHYNNKSDIQPYNGNVFEIRNEYHNIFP